MEEKDLMTETVQVVAIVQNRISVEPLRCHECSICAGRCRNSRLFYIFAPERSVFSFPVSAARSYKVGDKLMLSFSQQALVAASALVYMIPLVILLVLSLVGYYALGLTELALAAFLGGSGGVLFYLSHRLKPLEKWRQLLIPRLVKHIARD